MHSNTLSHKSCAVVFLSFLAVFLKASLGIRYTISTLCFIYLVLVQSYRCFEYVVGYPGLTALSVMVPASVIVYILFNYKYIECLVMLYKNLTMLESLRCAGNYSFVFNPRITPVHKPVDKNRHSSIPLSLLYRYDWLYLSLEA